MRLAVVTCTNHGASKLNDNIAKSPTNIYVYAAQHTPISVSGSQLNDYRWGMGYSIVCNYDGKTHRHWGYGFFKDASLMAAHGLLRILAALSERETTSTKVILYSNYATKVHDSLSSITRYSIQESRGNKKAKKRRNYETWEQLNNLYKLCLEPPLSPTQGLEDDLVHKDLIDEAATLAKEMASKASSENQASKRRDEKINADDRLSLDWLLPLPLGETDSAQAEPTDQS